MDALKEVTLAAELKKSILDQLHAIFGPKYPTGCTFAVTTSVITVVNESFPLREPEAIFKAQAIVYTIPSSSIEWELLRESSGFKGSISAAMGSLLGDLQAEMGKIAGPMQYGDVYTGNDYVL